VLPVLGEGGVYVEAVRSGHGRRAGGRVKDTRLYKCKLDLLAHELDAGSRACVSNH
jgi:hypothetical protein